MSSYKKQAVQYSPCKRQNGFLEWRNEFQDYCQNLGMALFRPYTEKIYYWNSMEKDRYSVSWGSVHKKSGSPIRCLEKIIMLLWYHNERYSLNKPSGSKEAWPFVSTKRLMLKATEGLHWDYWACFFWIMTNFTPILSVEIVGDICIIRVPSIPIWDTFHSIA